MFKKALVIINETHNLLEEQEKILNSKFEQWERLNIPNEGLNKNEIYKLACELTSMKNTRIVFISPIPLLMKYLAKKRKPFMVFHNDRREKKELPNGKIIMSVATTGWELL